MLFSIQKRRYILGSIFIVPTVAMSVAMGWLLLDNLRLLLPTAVFTIAGASALWSAGSLASRAKIDPPLA